MGNWDEHRLNKMIQDGIEESLTVEYKGAGALAKGRNDEITKDISAMANSAGGTLIYGIAESNDPARRHLPERIDPIDRKFASKEWLENIASQIRPRISALKIVPIQLSSSIEHVVYVVEIPEGKTAHQATDRRYYKRYNFQSQPMDDHEVRDVMNRRAHPDISVTAKMLIHKRYRSDGQLGELVLTITNNSDVFAHHLLVVIHSPIRIQGKPIRYDNLEIDSGEDGVAFKLQYSNHASAPLFPRGAIKHSFSFVFNATRIPEAAKELQYFRWVVFADAMPMQSGKFDVDDVIIPPAE